MSHLGHRISALVDGELVGAELDHTVAHLARCGQCSAEAVELRSLKRRMTSLGHTAADAELTSRLIGLSPLGAGHRARFAMPSPWSAVPDGWDESPSRRTGRYVLASSLAMFLVSLSTAAFLAGGSAPGPGPQVTPPVNVYLLQHDVVTGVDPAGVGVGPVGPDVGTGNLPVGITSEAVRGAVGPASASRDAQLGSLVPASLGLSATAGQTVGSPSAGGGARPASVLAPGERVGPPQP